MKVQLTRDVQHATRRDIRYSAGTILSVTPATNQPEYKQKGLVFVDTPELRDDPYGILLDSSDYTKCRTMDGIGFAHFAVCQLNKLNNRLICDLQSIKSVKYGVFSDIPLRFYDDSWGELFIHRDSLGITGIVRARTWEAAYGICEDEFFPEADETIEELITEYGFKEEDRVLIRHHNIYPRNDVHTVWKFAEHDDYKGYGLTANGWEFVKHCELMTLDRDAWTEHARFQEAYGFRPNGPNQTDKLRHGIYAKDLNGDSLDVLTPKLAEKLGIVLKLECEELYVTEYDSTEETEDCNG